MASLICSLRTGYYYAQFSSRNKQPTRKTVALNTKKKRVAERLFFRLEEEYVLGTLDPWQEKVEVDPSPPPVERLNEAVDLYLGSCSHLKPITQRTYRQILFPFRDFIGENARLSSLSSSAIQRWLNSTSAGDVTRRKYVNHLGYFFRFLVSKGAMDSDPSQKVPLAKLPQMAPKALKSEDIERLLDTITRYSASSSSRISHTWLHHLIVANVHLGLRRGELIHLQWDHVDFERKVLTVRNTDSFTTKSSKERSVPLCPSAVAALTALLEKRNGKYVFQKDGIKLNENTLSKSFSKLRKMAGLPKYLNLHSTRHTFATSLAEKGVPVTVIQSLMGHSSVTTTERYMSTRVDVAEQWVSKAFGR